MKVLKAIVFFLGAFTMLYQQSNCLAQEAFNTEISLAHIIYNGDTLSKNITISDSGNYKTLNRIPIWVKGEEQVSAVIIFNRNKNKSKLKIRFDSWNGKKWKKPKLKLWCDGLHCSFNRWSSIRKSRGTFRFESEEHGFTSLNYFSKGDNTAIVSGVLKMIY